MQMEKIMEKNIVLIGFMGVGKGRTARALARETGRFAVDTDDLLESLVKKSIRKLFRDHGEAFFRQMEQKTAQWLRSSVQGTIISTGGGFYMVDGLQQIGEVVYLHSSLEAIIDGINSHPKAQKKRAKRPLLQNMEMARDLYQKRLPLYRALAKYEVDVEGRDIPAVAKEIAEISGIQS
jgi:shikimate kinase